MSGPRAARHPEAPAHRLCRLDDIAEGAARGFDPDAHGEDRFFVVRRGDSVHAYLNLCPHNGRPLDYAQDHFLSGDGSEIVCHAHGAHFAIDSGRCTAGACLGRALTRLPVYVRDGQVWLSSPQPADAPP